MEAQHSDSIFTCFRSVDYASVVNLNEQNCNKVMCMRNKFLKFLNILKRWNKHFTSFQSFNFKYGFAKSQKLKDET